MSEAMLLFNGLISSFSAVKYGLETGARGLSDKVRGRYMLSYAISYVIKESLK